MKLADVYCDWLFEGRLGESAPMQVARDVPDVELQMRWFAGEFGRTFRSTSGIAVSIVDFGSWNSAVGPHFCEALVAFGDAAPVRGGIELTNDHADWQRRPKTAEDEGTVLHVFVKYGKEAGAPPQTLTASGREIPQVRLNVSQIEFAPTESPAAESRCDAPLAALSDSKIRALLEAGAQYRLCRKAARLNRRNASPEEVLFQALAETLGYKNNKQPFTLLAQRFSLASLRRDRATIEPLLFGGSGFLSSTDLGSMPGDTRSYLRDVWEVWWPLRTEMERLILPPGTWAQGGVRPVNHPQRRVAALAEIVRNWAVIQTLAPQCNMEAIHGFFAQMQHGYWDFHYTLTSKRSGSRMALVGETRVNAMLANVFFPIAIANAAAGEGASRQSEAKRLWEAYRSMPAADSNQRVDLAAERLLGPAPAGRKLLKQAVFQQGLLQVYEDHCLQNGGNCATCTLRERLEQWNAEQPISWELSV